jgi:hypothetical protein
VQTRPDAAQAPVA